MDSLLPDLLEQGTRYQHYMELVDIFNRGIEALKSTKDRSDSDQKKLVELEGAVRRIEGRMDVLAKYSIKMAGLRKVVEFELPQVQKLLTEGEAPCQA